MASETEPAKLLLPYLQRADELQKHEPLVAYYCRLYAMERGLKIPQNERTKTTNSLLISLMNQLEKDKKSLKLGPEDSLHLEGFALNVFAKADKQDRAGRADLNTAKTFYAASIFFEILNQFGPLQPDLEQKQKYAVWKAADIRKALKEGRKPVAGPPGGGDDLSIPSTTPNGSMDLGKSEAAVTSPRSDSDPSPPFHDQLPPPPSNIPPPSHFHDNIDSRRSPDVPSSSPSHEFQPMPPPINRSDSSNYLHPSASFSSHDYPPPPSHRPENSLYSQTYHHPTYPQEPPPPPPPPQQHLPHNYATHETSSSFNYPNFQSYPSFTETSLPSVPSNYPSYYQGAETSYTPQSAPPTTSYPLTSQYASSSNRNGTAPEPTAPASLAQKYEYDCNYLPPPDKIAEAHKAARFAVGALAFDDVATAVDHLKKSLELLTNPSAAH